VRLPPNIFSNAQAIPRSRFALACCRASATPQAAQRDGDSASGVTILPVGKPGNPRGVPSPSQISAFIVTIDQAEVHAVPLGFPLFLSDPGWLGIGARRRPLLPTIL